MRLFILFLFLFIAATSAAQNAFTKAVIYKSDGSKVECYIKNTTNESTQQVFNYAMENGGKTLPIDVNSINKVEFEDGMILEKHLLSLAVISKPFLERRKMDYEFEENKFTGPVMVEKLMSGPYALYQFIDKYGFSHFYYKASSETGLQKLEYQVYVAEDSTIKLQGYYKSGSDLVQKRDYRNQLLFLANSAGCEKKLTTDISRTEYKITQLFPLFKKLNVCAGEAPVINNKYAAAQPKLRLTVNGGVAATSLTIPDPNQSSYPGLTAESFSSSISPLLGVSVELVPQKRQKNYVVSFDFLYHNYSATTDSLRSGSFTTGIGKFKFSAFSVSPTVRFRLTKTQTAPFIEFGFGFRTLAKNQDNYYYRNSLSGVEVNREIFYGKSTSVGYIGGVGVDLKKISFHARYTHPANKSNFYYSTIFIMAKFAVLGKTE